MKPMFYSDARFPPTLDQLHRIELAAGVEMPMEVRLFFLRLPGSWLSRDVLRFGDQTFKGIRIGGPTGDTELQLIRSNDSICLFFGASSRGQLFAIELLSRDRGAVYLCERQRGQSGSRIAKVADNLFAFLDMLEVDPRSDFQDHYKRFDDGGPEWVLQTYREFQEYLPTDEELFQFSDPSRLIDLELTETGPGVSKEYLDWIECAFRIRLPLDLRRFYSLHNGGRSTKRLFEYDGDGVDTSFLSMERSLKNEPPAWKSGEFVEYVKMSKYGSDLLLPAHMWPLGCTANPRYPTNLAFSTAKGEFGSIWLTTLHSEIRPVRLADSFSEFVAGTWTIP